MVFSAVKNILGRSRQHRDLGLEVRPDGLAWALEGEGGEPARSGFEACTPAARQDALGALVSREGLGQARVCAVIPVDQYQVFQIERPAVDDSELVDAVRWKLKDMLEYRVDEAVFDVFPFPGDGARGGGTLINVVCARKALVSELAKLAQRAGLSLMRVDIAELAIRNLAARLDANGRGVAMVFLRQNVGQMVLCKGPVLYLSRRLDITEGSLADPALQEPTIQGLALEIQRSLDYYESQMRQVPPRSTYVLSRPDGPPVARLLSGNIAGEVATFENHDELNRTDFRSLLAFATLLSVEDGAE